MNAHARPTIAATRSIDLMVRLILTAGEPPVGGAGSGAAAADMGGTYIAVRTAPERRHRIADVSSAPPRANIEYVGHGTVLVDLAGVKLLTDPLLRNRVTHLRRAVKVNAAALRGVDAVLISHLHYDHLDMPSLQRLGREMPVVAPKGSGALIKRQAGITNVTEMSAGDEIRVGALKVRAVPAEHEPLDVALLPIWGWGPSMGPGHMDPARAAEAAALLGARLAIPIHWGTYYPVHLGLRGPPAFLQTPPPLFEQAVRERSPATEVRVLQPGERTTI